MNDFPTLVQIILVVAATAAPIIVLVRLIAGQEPDGATGIFPPATGLPWPQGVQEEDPKRWRFA